MKNIESAQIEMAVIAFEHELKYIVGANRVNDFEAVNRMAGMTAKKTCHE